MRNFYNATQIYFSRLKKYWYLTLFPVILAVIPQIFVEVHLARNNHNSTVKMEVFKELLKPTINKEIECKHLSYELVDLKNDHYGVSKFSQQLTKKIIKIKDNYFFKKNDADLLIHLAKANLVTNKKIEKTSKKLLQCRHEVLTNFDELASILQKQKEYQAILGKAQDKENKIQQTYKKNVIPMFKKIGINVVGDISDIDINGQILKILNTMDNDDSEEGGISRSKSYMDFSNQVSFEILKLSIESEKHWGKFYQKSYILFTKNILAEL